MLTKAKQNLSGLGRAHLVHAVIGRGLRQGCSLFPLLYMICDEAMVIQATYSTQYGVPVS